ncbi:MAG: hypothetical protein HON90_13595 [Halobacteriovoraceae bacterium]|jgi:hypothetical protein|nr:hypothetical protein [Halobacteriovoraceae bacterium]
MVKKVLFITAQVELQQLANIFFSNATVKVDCIIVDSISKSVAILNSEQDIDVIFVGHSVKKDLDLKNLSQALIPHINREVVKIYGTNLAFRNTEFAIYYNELTPVSKILIDIHQYLGLLSCYDETYLPFPLNSLSLFDAYPFDCFFKIYKQERESYVHVFREKDDVDLVDIRKYGQKGVESVFVSVDAINDKIKVLENALRLKSSKKLGNDIEASFELTAQYALDILQESGMNLPAETLERNREGFATTKNIIKNSKDKDVLIELMQDSNDFYFKHVGMTSLICCYILEALELEESNIQKLCAAANFQNIFLKDKPELLVSEENELDSFDKENRERVANHALLAFDLLSKNPLVDSDVLKIVREHHGDKRGICFAETFLSSSKISTVFQIASLFSQQYLLQYEQNQEIVPEKIFSLIATKLMSKDHTIIRNLESMISIGES